MGTTGPSADSRTIPAANRPLSSVLLALTAGAATVEAVVLRGATRTLIHIPGIDRVEGPVRVVADLGRLTYYLAVVLLVASLVALVAWHRARSRGIAAASAILLFLAAAAGARLGVVGDAPVALAVLGAVAVLATVAWRGGGPRWRHVPVVALVAAFLVSGMHTVAQLAAGRGWPVGAPAAELLLAAEVLAVAAALTSPLLIGRASRMAMVVAAVAGALTLGALRAGGETMRNLMLWNVGLGGWLPDPVYVIAAALLAYSVVAAWRVGRREHFLAMVLLLCGGIGLHSTYQSGLVIAGFALLAAAGVAAASDTRGADDASAHRPGDDPAGQARPLVTAGAEVASRAAPR